MGEQAQITSFGSFKAQTETHFQNRCSEFQKFMERFMDELRREFRQIIAAELKQFLTKQSSSSSSEIAFQAHFSDQPFQPNPPSTNPPSLLQPPQKPYLLPRPSPPQNPFPPQNPSLQPNPFPPQNTFLPPNRPSPRNPYSLPNRSSTPPLLNPNPKSLQPITQPVPSPNPKQPVRPQNQYPPQGQPKTRPLPPRNPSPPPPSNAPLPLHCQTQTQNLEDTNPSRTQPMQLLNPKPSPEQPPPFNPNLPPPKPPPPLNYLPSPQNPPINQPPIRPIKFDFSILSAVNGLDWLSPRTLDFYHNRVADDQKGEIALLHLDGDGIPFIDWLIMKMSLALLPKFSEAFLRPFGYHGCGDFDGIPSKLQQKYTIDSYGTEFLCLASGALGWSEEQLTDCLVRLENEFLSSWGWINEPLVIITVVFLLHLASYDFFALFAGKNIYAHMAIGEYSLLELSVFILYVRCMTIDPANPGSMMGFDKASAYRLHDDIVFYGCATSPEEPDERDLKNGVWPLLYKLWYRPFYNVVRVDGTAFMFGLFFLHYLLNTGFYIVDIAASIICHGKALIVICTAIDIFSCHALVGIFYLDGCFLLCLESLLSVWVSIKVLGGLSVLRILRTHGLNKLQHFNTYGILIKGQDGHTIMNALMAQERSIKWYGSLEAHLLLENFYLPLKGFMFASNSSFLSSVSQVNITEGISTLKRSKVETKPCANDPSSRNMLELCLRRHFLLWNDYEKQAAEEAYNASKALEVWERVSDAPNSYALEGLIIIVGATVQWLRDTPGIIFIASVIEELKLQVEYTGRISFVPALHTSFAPWWRAYSKEFQAFHTKRTMSFKLTFCIFKLEDKLNLQGVGMLGPQATPSGYSP